jgi:hypothetical protein
MYMAAAFLRRAFSCKMVANKYACTRTGVFKKKLKGRNAAIFVIQYLVSYVGAVYCVCNVLFQDINFSGNLIDCERPSVHVIASVCIVITHLDPEAATQ